VLETLQAWRGNAPPLPSCPPRPLRFTQRRDRPSPRFDADADGGMGVTVGRVEACPILGIKLFVLGHNTIRGAAGAAIANAELLIASGRI
jgi:aspartate-semialdehyde dehydrogenase